MLKKIFVFMVLSSIALQACNTIDKQLQGGWVVDEAYIYGEPVFWDLYGNGFNLEQDHLAILPNDGDPSDRVRETGKWKVLKENDLFYLQINTTNKVFNRKFQIYLYEVWSPTGCYVKKMILTADSIRFDCTKFTICR